MSALELAILGVLADGPQHGYELQKRIASVAGPAPAVSFGSLYPALGRFEKAGTVTASTEAPERGARIPMTGSLDGEAIAFRLRRGGRRGGRARKVYAITDPGRLRLDELLSNDSVDDRCFGLKLAFSDELEPAVLADQLARRRRLVADRLVELRRAVATAGDRGGRRLRVALLEHQITRAEAEAAWLTTLTPSHTDAGGSPQ